MKNKDNILQYDVSKIEYTGETKKFITVDIGGQFFGLSVDNIRDVLTLQKITKIPLSPPEVVGVLNLRGRIVTAIDVRPILGLPKTIEPKMSVVVEYKNDLYSLLVDTLGDVLTLPIDQFYPTPENLSKTWQEVSVGIFQLKEDLLIILDVNKLLQKISSIHMDKIVNHPSDL